MVVVALEVAEAVFASFFGPHIILQADMMTGQAHQW